MPYAEIRKPGWLTTIQDAGRWGMQAQGVPVSGPMDWFSHGLANRLVGNIEDAATLEITMNGPEVLFGGNVTFAVTGAEFPLMLNGAASAMNKTGRATSGDILTFGLSRRGARSYIAVAGGFQVPPVLGSRATHILSGLGGFRGRALRAGDRIAIGSVEPIIERDLRTRPDGLPDGGATLRVLSGPHADRFARETLMALHSARYVLSPNSDRMGYRLKGPALLQPAGASELISGATVAGAVQAPASGQPILLMADRATTGGYPIIAVVISADLPLAGQLAPGDWIQFAPCTRDEAVAALRERERALNEVF